MESLLTASSSRGVEATEPDSEQSAEEAEIQQPQTPPTNSINESGTLEDVVQHPGDSTYNAAQQGFARRQAEPASVPPQSRETGEQPPTWILPPRLQFLNRIGATAEKLRAAASRESPRRRLYAPMIPQAEALNLIEFFLDETSSLFPLFDKKQIINMCEQRFPANRDSEEAAWWACLNTMVAIGMQRKAVNSAFQTICEFAWSYFKNAYAVFDEIISTDGNLLSIQAILLMAIFLSSTVDTRTTSMLVSAAIRMIRILDLDSELDGEPDDAEAEQRRNVFWIAYMLDVDLSLRSGLPPNITDLPEMQLPQERLLDESGQLSDSLDPPPVDFFRLEVDLSLIRAKIYRLYTPDASATYEQLTMRASQLRDELEAWRIKLPSSIRPNCARKSNGSISFPLATLHLDFYYSACLVHQRLNLPSMTGEPAVSTQSPQDLAEIFSRPSIDAARAMLSMLDHIDFPSLLDLWYVFRVPGR